MRYSQRPVEQRRSRRYRTELPVDLVVGKIREHARAVDVSRHGLFVATATELEERQLVQLVIELPGGALPATAVVSHRKSAKSGRPGVGLQLFALSSWSKQRWDDFVYGIDSQSQSVPTTMEGGPDLATFLIKLKNVNRLLDFYDQNVRTGSLYLTTPVLREQSAEVALNMIHPSSEEEFILYGKVKRVCIEQPKGMEIKLDPMPESELAAFREFVTTGARPAKPASKPNVPADAPPKQSEDETPSEDISIDIVVDDAALEDSAQFFWNDVTQEDMIIDFDVSGFSQVKDGGTQDVVPQATNGTTVDVPAATLTLADLDKQRTLMVSVRCEACDCEYGKVHIGAAKGALGALASHQPYWWPNEDKIVSVLRLDSPTDRKSTRERLGEVELNRTLSLRLAFKIADMSSPPRCPDGSAARVTPVVRALKDAVPKLVKNRKVDLVATCRSCQADRVVAERWD